MVVYNLVILEDPFAPFPILVEVTEFDVLMSGYFTL